MFNEIVIIPNSNSFPISGERVIRSCSLKVFTSGKHLGSRVNNTHCFPWGQSLSAYYQQQKAKEEQINRSRFFSDSNYSLSRIQTKRRWKTTLELIKPTLVTTWLFSHLLSANSNPLGQTRRVDEDHVKAGERVQLKGHTWTKMELFARDRGERGEDLCSEMEY